MKASENQFVSQSRWNDVYGKSNLRKISDAPDQFIYELNYISRLPLVQQKLLEKISADKDFTKLKILELGSGRGEFSIILAKLGVDVTGIDIGDDLVKLSTQTATLNNVDCIFQVGNIDYLDFNDGVFDYVVGNAILHHLPVEGIVSSLKESYRVLKPDGKALFSEPIENSQLFDFLQNMVPVGKVNSPQYRPSILNRKKWLKYLVEADDRALTNNELIAAKGNFDSVTFDYFGFLIRLSRLTKNKKIHSFLLKLDRYFTSTYSPLKKLSQQVLVEYKKK